MLIPLEKVKLFYEQIKRTPKFYKRKMKKTWKISDICYVTRSFSTEKGKYIDSIKSPDLAHLAGAAIRSNKVEFTVYAATLIAYAPAFQHVMKYNERDLNKRILQREKSSEFAYSLFLDFVSREYSTFDEFWLKATDVMVALRKCYHDMGETDFSIGNAQKWFNMFIKHFYCLCAMNEVSEDIVRITESNMFNVASFAVDRIMIEGIIQPQLGIDFYDYTKASSWSKCDEVEVFEAYERQVWNRVKELGYKSLFHWEFATWEPMKEFED